jgi:hypothetical protein
VESGGTIRRGRFQAQAQLAKRAADFDIGQEGNIFSARQNPGQLPELLSRLEADLDDASSWIPGTKIPEVREGMQSNLVAAAAEGLIQQKDFVAARLFVEGDEFGQFLDAEQRSKLVLEIEKGEVSLFVETESEDIASNMAAAQGSTGSVNFDSLAAAVVQQESRNNPNAVSSKGAVGLMQVLPGTAKDMADRLGVEFREELLTDPTFNKMVGEEYLRVQMETYDNNMVLALAAYNAGPGMVNDWINGTNKTGKNNSGLRLGDPRTGEISTAEFVSGVPFEETRNYVQEVPERMGISPFSPEEVLEERLRGIDDPAVRGRVARAALAEWSLSNASREKALASEKMSRETEAARLDIAVSRNEATYEDIKDAFDRGILTPSQFSKLIKQKDGAVASAEEGSKDLRNARTRLSGDGSWNVYAKEDRDAVDLLFDASEEKSADTAFALIGKTGIAPKAFVADIRQRVENGDAEAFELADQALAASSSAFSRDGGQSIIDKVEEFRGLRRVQFSTAEAARRVSRPADERAAIAARATEVNKEFAKLKTSDILNSLPQDTIFSTPDINESRIGRLRNDFETAYREARTDGYEPDEAKGVAAGRVGRIWGLTSVNTGSSEVMRFPPEFYYPPDAEGEHGYIREQAIEAITEIDGQPPARMQFVANDVLTGGDIRAGQPPRYHILYVDANGFNQQLPGTFRPDASFITPERREAFEAGAQRAEGIRERRAETRKAQAENFRNLGFPDPAEAN